MNKGRSLIGNALIASFLIGIAIRGFIVPQYSWIYPYWFSNALCPAIVWALGILLLARLHLIRVIVIAFGYITILEQVWESYFELSWKLEVAVRMGWMKNILMSPEFQRSILSDCFIIIMAAFIIWYLTRPRIKEMFL